MAWVVKLEEIRDNKTISRRKVMTIDRPHRIESVDDIGLSRAEAKQLLSSVQTLVATAQFQLDADSRGAVNIRGKSDTLEDHVIDFIDFNFPKFCIKSPRFHCFQSLISIFLQHYHFSPTLL